MEESIAEPLKEVLIESVKSLLCYYHLGILGGVILGLFIEICLLNILLYHQELHS